MKQLFYLDGLIIYPFLDQEDNISTGLNIALKITADRLKNQIEISMDGYNGGSGNFFMSADRCKQLEDGLRECRQWLSGQNDDRSVMQVIKKKTGFDELGVLQMWMSLHRGMHIDSGTRVVELPPGYREWVTADNYVVKLTEYYVEGLEKTVWLGMARVTNTLYWAEA
jgi:hypothetical protein